MLSMSENLKNALQKIADGRTDFTSEESRAINGLIIFSREHARNMLAKDKPN